MRVGGTHHWYYERRMEGGKWHLINGNLLMLQIREELGMPQKAQALLLEQNIIGIFAHQNVRKLDANTYTTSMDGLNYKLAHKRVGIKRWSLTQNAQRDLLIKILEEYVAQLKREMVEEASENNILRNITTH
jgi:hypothetical protein